MGWAGGSRLAEEVWETVRNSTPEGRERAIIARKIIGLFEGEDCDTMDEAETLCQDAGRKCWADAEDMTYDEFEALPEYKRLE